MKKARSISFFQADVFVFRTYHLFWRFKIRLIDCRCEWVQIFWPAGQVRGPGEICVSSRFMIGGGFAAYEFSSHHQSIAEHFEQKCRSDVPRFSSGVPRPLSTALYILFHPPLTVRDIYEHRREAARDVCFAFGDL